MIDPVSFGVGAASLAFVEYVALPVGSQVRDAIDTNPPEQSNQN